MHVCMRVYYVCMYVFMYGCMYVHVYSSVRIVQKEVGGLKFFFRWGGVERRGGGGEIFFRRGVEKEVGGRILSSIIEERGKLHHKPSLWCKKSVQRSPYCFPQQYLIIISRAPHSLCSIIYRKIRQNLK